MGQYKVPQNVEAEDKIIGFLTLKQFIYTVIGVVIGLISFLTLHKAPIVMLIVGLPPTALFLLLGLYQRQDQPFEALFLSLVSFLAKPRRRQWIKEPIEEVFKIEAPKVTKAVTQRDPRQVRGQLEQLSQVVDTRGWGSKKAELQEPNDETSLQSEGRLVEPALPDSDEAIDADVSLADDILDFQNNPNAHNIGSLIEDQTQAIRQRAVDQLQAAAKAQSVDRNSSTVNRQQPTNNARRTADGGVTPIGSSQLTTDAEPLPGSTYQPSPSASPSTRSGNNYGTQLPTAPGNESTKGNQPAVNTPLTTANDSVSDPARRNDEVSVGGMTANPLDGILKLAMENDDLPVSQIAAQANRQQASLAEGQSVSLRDNGNS